MPVLNTIHHPENRETTVLLRPKDQHRPGLAGLVVFVAIYFNCLLPDKAEPRMLVRTSGSGLIQVKSQVRLVVDVILAENTGQLGQMLVAEYESEQLQIQGKTGVVTTWLPVHRLLAIHTNRQQPLITLDEYLGYRVSGSSGPFPVQRQSRHSPWHLPRY